MTMFEPQKKQFAPNRMSRKAGEELWIDMFGELFKGTPLEKLPDELGVLFEEHTEDNSCAPHIYGTPMAVIGQSFGLLTKDQDTAYKNNYDELFFSVYSQDTMMNMLGEGKSQTLRFSTDLFFLTVGWFSSHRMISAEEEEKFFPAKAYLRFKKSQGDLPDGMPQELKDTITELKESIEKLGGNMEIHDITDAPEEIKEALAKELLKKKDKPDDYASKNSPKKRF